MINHQQKFFDYHAPNWHHNIQVEQKIRLQHIFRDLTPFIEAPLLDLGCGTGILLPYLTDILNNSKHIYQVDLSYEMLIRNKEEHLNLYPANYVQATAENLAFKSNMIKSIVVFAAYAHFVNKARALSEFHRILQSKGTLIILHLFGHKELNRIHYRAGASVKNDRLKPIQVLKQQMKSAGFQIHKADESPDLYLSIGRKG